MKVQNSALHHPLSGFRFLYMMSVDLLSDQNYGGIISVAIQAWYNKQFKVLNP